MTAVTIMKLILSDGELEVESTQLSMHFGFFEMLDQMDIIDNTMDMRTLPITSHALQYLMELSEARELAPDKMKEFITGNFEEKLRAAYDCLDVKPYVTRYIEDGHLYNRMCLFKACPDMYKATVDETTIRRSIAQGQDAPYFGLVEINDNMRETVRYTPLDATKSLLFSTWEKRRANKGGFRQVGDTVLKLQKPHDIVMKVLSLGNVVVAGGYALNKVRKHETAYNDIDIFTYGLNEKQATQKLQQIANVVKGDACCTGNSVTFINTVIGEDENITMQVILRLYKSPAEILHGFDIQACKVLVTMEKGELKYYGTASFIESMRYNCVWVDTERQSSTYAIRLMKYYCKHLDVLVTGLDRKRVPAEIMCTPFGDSKGMTRLLRLEYEVRNDKFVKEDDWDQKGNHPGPIYFALQRTTKRHKMTACDYENALTFKHKFHSLLVYVINFGRKAMQFGWYNVKTPRDFQDVQWQVQDPSSQTVIGSFNPEDEQYYRQAYDVSDD